MKKLKLLGLLSLVTINFLLADEYISDAYISDVYLEEIAAQSDMVSESIDSLPITKTMEEQAREQKIVEEEILEEKILQVDNTSTSSVDEEVIQANSTSTHSMSEETQGIQKDAYVNALKQAKDEKKIIMLTIRATDCKYCDRMEEGTLSDESVQDAIKDDFVNIHYNQDLDTLPLGLQNGATPMFIFVNIKEDIINQYPGMRSPSEFKTMLKEILAK